MTVPAWARARAALDAGDLEAARAAIDEAEQRTRSLQQYSVHWIASLLSFVGRQLGEGAVEAALRASGDEFVRDRRGPGDRWWALPAEVRARAIASAMVANGGTCTVEEAADEIVLRFRCGSGGRLIDDEAYEDDETPGDGYLVLREPAGRTFGRDRLPVYCAHCSVNNELQPIEWDGLPVTVEVPPDGPGGECVHHLYRDPAAVPSEVWVRLGVAPPLTNP